MDRRMAIGVAYLQLHDPILRIPWTEFHRLVEIALGRGVMTHEFGLAHKQLQAEITTVWEKECKQN